MGPIPVQPRAALSLDFLIVGAGAFRFHSLHPLRLMPISPTFICSLGIGGLASAYSLLRSGHRVTILEAYPQNGRSSYTGLRVPPNMSKILNEWGLTDEVRAKTRPCRLAAFDDRQCSSRFYRPFSPPPRPTPPSFIPRLVQYP